MHGSGCIETNSTVHLYLPNVPQTCPFLSTLLTVSYWDPHHLLDYEYHHPDGLPSWSDPVYILYNKLNNIFFFTWSIVDTMLHEFQMYAIVVQYLCTLCYAHHSIATICLHVTLLWYHWPYSLCCTFHLRTYSFQNWKSLPFIPLHLPCSFCYFSALWQTRVSSLYLRSVSAFFFLF